MKNPEKREQRKTEKEDKEELDTILFVPITPNITHIYIWANNKGNGRLKIPTSHVS